MESTFTPARHAFLPSFLSLIENAKSYVYVARIRLIDTTAYRFDIVVSLLVRMLFLIANTYLWHTVYSGKQAVAGVSEPEMITFAILNVLLMELQRSDVQYVIASKVNSGEIAMDFLKPINLLLNWMADDIGRNVGWFVLSLIPTAVFILLFFQPVIPIPAGMIPILLVSVVFSFVIMWLMAAIVGLMSFWFMELGYLGIVQEEVVRLLSGSFVPLWFFPQWVQDVSRFLPFLYVGQFPLSIAIGKVPYAGAMHGVAVQAAWVGILWLALAILWRKAQKHVLIQGG